MLFFSEMGSLDISMSDGLSPAQLMLEIWNYSEHVHHNPPSDPSGCNCVQYLEWCIDSAREQ